MRSKIGLPDWSCDYTERDKSGRSGWLLRRKGVSGALGLIGFVGFMGPWKRSPEIGYTGPSSKSSAPMMPLLLPDPVCWKSFHLNICICPSYSMWLATSSPFPIRNHKAGKLCEDQRHLWRWLSRVMGWAGLSSAGWYFSVLEMWTDCKYTQKLILTLSHSTVVLWI